MPEGDFLDDIIARHTERNPAFPRLVEAAVRRRDLFEALAKERERQHRTPTEIAAIMDTSESSITRLEDSAADSELSTVDRYADALGYSVQYHLIPTAQATDEPAVVVHAERN